MDLSPVKKHPTERGILNKFQYIVRVDETHKCNEVFSETLNVPAPPWLCFLVWSENERRQRIPSPRFVDSSRVVLPCKEYETDYLNSMHYTKETDR